MKEYTFGEIGNDEKFKVQVRGTKQVGDETSETIYFTEPADRAQLQFNWTLTPNTNNALGTVTTDECKLPSGSVLYAVYTGL